MDLTRGTTIERELSGGQTHSYQLSLTEAQYLYVVVDQRGIDVVLVLFSPEGKKLSEVDSPNGENGPEELRIIVPGSGIYRLDVQALETHGPMVKVCPGRDSLI
jgi:hypothetical protein